MQSFPPLSMKSSSVQVKRKNYAMRNRAIAATDHPLPIKAGRIRLNVPYFSQFRGLTIGANHITVQWLNPFSTVEICLDIEGVSSVSSARSSDAARGSFSFTIMFVWNTSE